jgi:hypothetical protein
MFSGVDVEVKLRPTVTRPVCLGVRHPSGTPDQFFFLLENFCKQLRVCYFVAPSLTRGRVCNLPLLLVFAITVTLGSESRGTQDHILLSQFLRLPQPGGPGPRIYIPQEQGGPVIPPGTGFPFRRLLRLAGLRWRYSIPPPHGIFRCCLTTQVFNHDQLEDEMGAVCSTHIQFRAENNVIICEGTILKDLHLM